MGNADIVNSQVVAPIQMQEWRRDTPLFITSQLHWSHIEKISLIALELAKLGHPITFITGKAYEKHVSGLHENITFEPMFGLQDKMSDQDTATYLSLTKPEDQELFLFKRVFVDSLPRQFETYQTLFRAFRQKYGSSKLLINMFDITTTGHHLLPFGCNGIRPDVNIGLNIAPLTLDSVDTYPFRIFQTASRLPETGKDAHALHAQAYEQAKLEHYNRSLNQHWWTKLNEMGASKHGYIDICHALSAVPDHLLCFGVPEFEFPRSDLRRNVKYFGAFPTVGRLPDSAEPALPVWWEDVIQAKATGKSIVVVSQGTVEINLDDLLLPTIEALGHRHDILVIATLVTMDPEELTGLKMPKNLRIAKFIPFDLLLPLTTILISNGGYGAVQHCLRMGVPLIVAGAGQDKAVTNALVEWTKVGINLGCRRPGAKRIAEAVNKILGDSKFALKANEMGSIYDQYDIGNVVGSLIETVVQDTGKSG